MNLAETEMGSTDSKIGFDGTPEQVAYAKRKHEGSLILNLTLSPMSRSWGPMKEGERVTICHEVFNLIYLKLDVVIWQRC